MTAPSYVRDISTLGLADADQAGGKGANLGEMVTAGLPVPPAFVVLRDGYRDSMRAGGVDDELSALHAEALATADDSARLDELCHRMQGLVGKAGLADGVREQLLDAYRRLGTATRVDPVVAVRSSATGEDGRDASFAGMNRTITNMRGADDVVDAVLRCWQSLFTPRVITYRRSRGSRAHPRWPSWCSRCWPPTGPGSPSPPIRARGGEIGSSSRLPSGRARWWSVGPSSPTPTSSTRRPSRCSIRRSDARPSRSCGAAMDTTWS